MPTRLVFTSKLATLLLISVTTGCASTITAVTGRPITSDHLDEFSSDGRRKELNKLKTLSGDRRLIRVQFTEEPDSSLATLPDGTFNSKWVICAETQADAIAARGGQSALTVSGEGSATDEYIEALTVTNIRTQLSDIVRQLGWQVCNAYMNGALTKEQYRRHLEKLTDNAFLALRPNGEAPPAAQDTTSDAPANATFRPDTAAPPEPPKTKKNKTGSGNSPESSD